MPCSRWLRPATTVASSSSAFSREPARRTGSAALNSRMASASLPARISPAARIPRAEAASKCFSPTRLPLRDRLVELGIHGGGFGKLALERQDGAELGQDLRVGLGVVGDIQGAIDVERGT